MTIRVVDVDCSSTTGIWTQALDGDARPARALLRAFRREVDDALDSTVLAALLRKGASVLNALMGMHYRAEAEELASLLGTSPGEVLVANLAYDLSHAAGCSTFVRPTAEGPLHARNLDWSFPDELLRTHTTIVRFANARRGSYATVTWPGLFGALTALAPGRFAVTVNYVCHGTDSRPLAVAQRALLGVTGRAG